MIENVRGWLFLHPLPLVLLEPCQCKLEGPDARYQALEPDRNRVKFLHRRTYIEIPCIMLVEVQTLRI